jgi:hypothetical protein
MASIRRLLYWWDRGDVSRVIASLEAASTRDDAEHRQLEEAQRILDRRVDALATELANQRRQQKNGSPHNV